LDRILKHELKINQAALWFLGQSGFVIKSAGVTVAIDPYLSDSVAKVSPSLTRNYPPPIKSSALNVDIYIATHDHLDHLDPETVTTYKHKETTTFVGPRFVCSKFATLGVPQQNIVKIDSGETKMVRGVEITGIYAIANDPAVIDTAGYKIVFANGRSVYHTSDTDFSQLLLQSAPSAGVGLFCINGKWGNLNIEQAAELANKVNPRFAIPHHYDLMKLNSENPETFKHQMNYINPRIEVKILKPAEVFVWTDGRKRNKNG
jgi:L-ascorbate 6-phosphate lactonase